MDVGMILPRINQRDADDLSRSDLDFPTGAQQLDPATIIDAARRLEEVGYDSIWITDSIGRRFPNPDPLVTLAAIAMVTERARLGVSVLQLPIRNPVTLAHQVMTTQLLAGDRLVLGVGAGSTPIDFETTGTSFDDRFRNFAASLDVMRRLWRGETVDGANLYPFDRTMGGPPLIIGSWGGSRWIPKAATDFDGWVGSARKTTWRTIEEGITRFREAGGKWAVLTNVQIDPNPDSPADEPDEPDRQLVPCGPELGKERLRRLQELGFDEVVLRTWDHTQSNVSQLLDLARGAIE